VSVRPIAFPLLSHPWAATVSSSRSRRLREAATKRRLYNSNQVDKAKNDDLAKWDLMSHQMQELTTALYSFTAIAMSVNGCHPSPWYNVMPEYLPSTSATVFNSPATELDMPVKKFDLPASDFDASAKESEGPAKEFDMPAEEFDIPAQEFEVPAAELDISAKENTLPAAEFTVPTKEFELPATKFTVPTKEFELPATEFTVPTKNFEGPASKFDVPAEELEFTAEQVKCAISMAADNSAAGFGYERHLFDEAVDKMHSIYEMHPEKRYCSKNLSRALELAAKRCGEAANSADSLVFEQAKQNA